jgi:pimeloyl-ACP methyl ester carboxylesterase
MARALVAAAAALPLIAACSSLGTPGAPPVRAATLQDGAAACAAAPALPVDGGRITEARYVAAGTERSRQPGINREVGDPLPAHCVLRGRLDERTGADGKPYHTGFELRLPTAFAGRLLYQGGGGNDGVINNAVGRNTGALGWADHALARGFAAVTTDAGHQSPAPDFGLDPQARIEHAYRAHQRTATVAKSLVGAYYGRGADRSYFIGCSGGGRQGMMFTQRFPELFDGVIAVAPAMRVSEGATISAAWTVQKFLAAAPRGADGKPVLARALSDGDLKLVADRVLERCDAADGLRDGLVQRKCDFDPSVLRCTGAKSDACLSGAQVDALAAVMAGPRNKAGKPLYFGWPWDPGLAGVDWRNWTLGTAAEGAPPNARHITLMAGALGYEFVTPPDPGLTTLNLDFDRDPPRMAAFHREYGTADDVALDGYRRRGGKLMFFHGTADPIFSSIEMEDYMARLHARHGAAAANDWTRLFLVPGMNHCAGGPATDAFDGLASLVRWVEQGEAPARVVARGTAGAFQGVERPLCPWPSVATYDGRGDPKSAASFACR